MKFQREDADYIDLIGHIKDRISQAQVSAAKKVNQELILLYLDIGQSIVRKQQQAGWGDSVVEKISRDLRAAFPHMSGLSARNLWAMKRMYEAYTDPVFLQHTVADSRAGLGQPEILPQAVAELLSLIPWGHHRLILEKVTTPAARLHYLRVTAQLGWSRSILLNQIKSKAFERAKAEPKAHNFPLTLPELQAEQAAEMMKSTYNLEFLGIGKAAKERESEDHLITNLQQFIQELGYGFCFIGRQYRLAVGRKEYFIDLLFYHRFLKSLVAIDLKIGEFEPEFAGKMDFYLNVLNDKERAHDDNPSIGIILCAERDDIEVEYSLKTKTNPIGVVEYQLQSKLPAALRGKLPTPKQFTDALRRIKKTKH